MIRAPYKVGLVVDREFGDRIALLSRSFHVWVVDSPINTPVIQRLWDSEQADPQADPFGPGITSFSADQQEVAEDICARIVSDLADHHGEFAHDPPWQEIEVFGAELSPALRGAFKEIGGNKFELTQYGFKCRR